MAFKNTSHYFQHLTFPHPKAVQDLRLVSFKNHAGFSDETLQFLAPHVSFDYMGDATYEGNAVSKCLVRMEEKAHSLATAKSSLTAKLPDFTPYKKDRALYPNGLTVDAYVIAYERNMDDVLALIPKLGDHETELKANVKDGTSAYVTVFDLHKAKQEALEIDMKGKPGGWLDIKNNFMVFIDAKMYAFFAQDVFGLTP